MWLLIVFIIVGIALPNWLRFGAKSLQSEAKTNLHAIWTTQVAYLNERHTFAGGPAAFENMNWAPAGQSRYAYFCGDEVIANEVGSPVAQRPGGDWPYPVQPASSATGFTCMAQRPHRRRPEIYFHCPRANNRPPAPQLLA